MNEDIYIRYTNHIIKQVIPWMPPRQNPEWTKARHELTVALTMWFAQFPSVVLAIASCPALATYCHLEEHEPKPWPKDDPKFVAVMSCLARAKLLAAAA